MITNLKRNASDSFVSIESLAPLKMPEVYTFDSRSEAVCAIILEQYIPEWKLERGKTWQVPLSLGKLADFRVNDTIIEFHPIVLRHEFTSSHAFWKFKAHLESIPAHKAEELVESIKIEKLAEYTESRKQLILNSRDINFCDLEVCPSDESFAMVVSKLIGNIDYNDILREWRHIFETV